jgi:quercetin dioxygenase-like cupin family protein
VLTNPFTGQTLTFISEDDDLLVMETSYEAGGPPAPAHLHPSQEETFEILSGSVRASIDGEVRILTEGDVLVIPAGTPHEFGGDDENEGTARWEVRPPLRTREFFEGLFGALQAAADAQAGGSEEPPPAFDVAEYGDVFRLA